MRFLGERNRKIEDSEINIYVGEGLTIGSLKFKKFMLKILSLLL